jgi:hypothetical protein
MNMPRFYLKMSVLIILTFLALSLALQVTSAASTKPSLRVASCKNIMADRQTSIRAGKTQSVIRGLRISKYTSIKYIISSQNNSSTRVRSVLSFYGGAYGGTDLVYVLPGETMVKTFLTNSSPKLNVHLDSYTGGARNARNTVRVNIEGCR